MSAFGRKRTSHLAADIIPNMSLLDLIIEKIGIRTASDSVAEDPEAQILIASLLALVAKSDGGILPDENMRMMNLLSKRFNLSSTEASDLITRTMNDLPSHDQLDEIVNSVNEELSNTQKEDLMFMVLCVIAADDKKDPGEMKMLNKLIDTFRLPDATMQKMYEGSFDGLFH